MDRETFIRHRMADHLLVERAVAVVCPSRTAWQIGGVDGPYRFGWAPPMPIDNDDLLLAVSFCPELIDATTVWLSDEQLATYVETILTFLDEHIESFGESPTEIRQRVEDAFRENAPDSLVLMTEVEVGAIEHGIVDAATPID